MRQDEREYSIDALIGENVRKFREMKGLERRELADLFHITDDALYRIEKGKTGLSGVYAYTMANTLNCDMNFIFGRNRIPQTVQIDETDAAHRKTIARMLRYYAELLEKEK